MMASTHAQKPPADWAGGGLTGILSFIILSIPGMILIFDFFAGHKGNPANRRVRSDLA